MSEIYELIGRAVVEHYRRRHGRQIRAAGAMAIVVAALGAAAYLASRESEGEQG